MKMHRSVWDVLTRSAQDVKTGRQKIKAFLLFRPKRAEWNLITQISEIPVKLVKENSSSGPIFRWQTSGSKTKYYPARSQNLTNRGTAIIQPNLEMTLHYAFWMGEEYGISGSGGFHINMWWDDLTASPIYKAYYVNAKGEPRTDGEFVECKLEIIDDTAS